MDRKTDFDREVALERVTQYDRLCALFVVMLCIAANAILRFMPDDPAASADSDTLLTCCLVFGAFFTPVPIVYLAKRLFEGKRFRFLLSWLVGFLMVDIPMLCCILFPRSHEEGYYMSKAEECVMMSVFMLVIIGMLNMFDSLVEWWLDKLKARFARHWLIRLVLRLAGSFCLTAFVLWLFVGLPQIISRLPDGGTFPPSICTDCWPMCGHKLTPVELALG